MLFECMCMALWVGRNIDKFSFFLSPARAVPPKGGNCARGGKEIFLARGGVSGGKRANFVEKNFRFHAFIVSYAALVFRDM